MMKLQKLTLVSGNKNKAGEIGRILDIPIEIKEIELDEIQELDVEKVAMHKLKQAFEIIKKPVIVDDVSLEVKAWNGFPGPLIKWLLKASGGENARVMLKMLEGVKDRRVTAKLAIGFHDGTSPRIFIGEANGTIAEEITGDNGFGWDPVFIPEGFDQTFAQMDPHTKDSVSHRGRALAQLADFIKTNYEL
jgi:non-canonical purine NTP pyrophosphatase (RdgB/HAM1 family)